MPRTATDIFNRAWHHLFKQMLAPLVALIVMFALPIQSGNSSRHSDHEREREKANSPFGIAIENFGRINEHYYRGSQPEPEDYKDLFALGVRTIIDLRNDPAPYEKPLATAAGLRYINLPMSDKHYPPPETASQFLAIANNPLNWPIYVHCIGGRHRTGVMTAVYRMTVDKWDLNRAYEEMKHYDFYSRWGHEAMKKFVFDYYRELAKQGALAPTAAQPTSASSPGIAAVVGKP